MSDASKPDETPKIDTRSARQYLAFGTVGVSAIGVLGIAWAAIGYAGDDRAETTKLVFTAVLPLLGTWVGTVLSFYFTKDSYEAASRETRQTVSESGLAGRLRATPVRERMTPVGRMKVYRMAADKTEEQVGLAELLGLMTGPITRLPILDAQDAIKFLVHKSVIVEFHSTKVRETTAFDLNDLGQANLKLLLDQDDNRRRLGREGLAFVAVTATVADARNRMREKQGCEDVIVTQSGKSDEPVLGWLTNNDIANLAD